MSKAKNIEKEITRTIYKKSTSYPFVHAYINVAIAIPTILLKYNVYWQRQWKYMQRIGNYAAFMTTPSSLSSFSFKK